MGVTIKDLDSYNTINSIDFGEMIVFFKFGADWCIPCNEVDKVLAVVPNCAIYHISIDNENFESFLIENNIVSIPYTIVKYKNNKTHFQGIRTLTQINEIIENLKSEDSHE